MEKIQELKEKKPLNMLHDFNYASLIFIGYYLLMLINVIWWR